MEVSSISLLLFIIAQVCFGANDELCPSPNIISPCTCDGEGINCMKVQSDSTLQQIFRSIPRPWGFRGVWIQITSMTSVPKNMFQGIQVQAFHLEVNLIHTVQQGAFSGSEQSAFSISVFGNQLSTFPFQDLKGFQFLQSFNIGRNKILQIPDGAFTGHKFLSQIIMAENLISYIGANSFQNLPNLMKIDLTHNRLNAIGPLAFAMVSHNPELQIFIANNTISTVSPSAFDGAKPKLINLMLNRLQHLEEAAFVPLIQRMSKVPGVIHVDYNPFACMGCKFLWMVINKDVLQYILPGFRCRDGRTVTMLNRMNIFC